LKQSKFRDLTAIRIEQGETRYFKICEINSW
jgi:hypothetical protein